VRHSQLNVYEVQLDAHWEQGWIGQVEQAITNHGGCVLASGGLTWSVRYAARASLEFEIKSALAKNPGATP
jgi:hypothetical protein